MARFEKSFYEWCLENNKEDWLDLWDYELNGCSPKDVGYGSNKKYYFKCPRGIHKSELKIINLLTNYKIELTCKQCNSIGQYLIDTYGENALEKYWDYRKNKINPFEVSRCSTIKIWIKCQEKDYHESYEIKCYHFYNGRGCPYCASRKIHPKDSFGQMLLDEYGNLEVIWDFEKNGDLDPFGLAKKSTRKVWLFCLEKDYHGSYEIKCEEFTRGNRCSYCAMIKIHPKDSFAQYHIDNTDKDFLEKYWSKKNTINPFGIAPNSTIKIWINCLNDEEHEDYLVSCHNFTKDNSRCPTCKESKGERKIREILNKNNISFIAQKTFPNLLGVRGRNLTYDFYIPEQNILIEYQGKQHEEWIKGFTDKNGFKRQQEHDKRKKEYAESHNIRLLEIWYWDFDNIEEILNKNIK